MGAQVETGSAVVSHTPGVMNWACLALVAFGAPLTLAWVALLGWLLYLAYAFA